MSASPDDLRTQDIKQRLEKLEADNVDLKRRVARGEKQRKWFFIALTALAIAIGVLLFLYIQIILSRADARRYNQHQFHMLVCDIPPSAQSNPARADFHCGPYRPAKTPSSGPSKSSKAAAGPSPSPRTTSSPQPTATRTGEQALRPSPTAGPSARAARPGRPQPSTRTQVRTRTVHPAPATRTKTRTVRQPGRPAPTPSPSNPGLLGGLLQGLLGSR